MNQKALHDAQFGQQRQHPPKQQQHLDHHTSEMRQILIRE